MSRYSPVINDMVRMRDAVELYCNGMRVRNGRIQCPFHNGKDYNCAIYEHHFVCYVCGEKGSVVRFVSIILDISDSEAEERLNDDFKLDLPIGNKPHSVASVALAMKKLKNIQHRNRMRDMKQETQASVYLTEISTMVWLYRQVNESERIFRETGEYPAWAGTAYRAYAEALEMCKEGGDYDTDR